MPATQGGRGAALLLVQNIMAAHEHSNGTALQVMQHMKLLRCDAWVAEPFPTCQ